MIPKRIAFLCPQKLERSQERMHIDSTDFGISYDICFMATDNDTVEIDGQLNSYYLRNQTKLAFIIFPSSAVIMCF